LLELRDQRRQSVGLLIRGEVPTTQTLDLQAELAQPFLREVNLPPLKGIFVAAANEEWKLTPIRVEETAEVQTVALRLVIGREAGASRKIEQAIMAVHGVVKFANLGVRNPIAFRPHYPRQQLEQGKGSSQPTARSVVEASQDWRGEPRMRVTVREKAPIEDEDSPYCRAAHRIAALGALKPASQMLQDDKRGKVEGDQHCGLDAERAPERFDQIGSFSGRIRIVFGLVAVAHADVLDKELRHLNRIRQMRQNFRPPK
jgi:hypothetical protein